VFAPPVAKPKAKAGAPSKNTSSLRRAAYFDDRRTDGAPQHLYAQAFAPNVSWNFTTVPIYSQRSAAASPTQTLPLTAMLRAIVKGRQSDALGAAQSRSPVEPEQRVSEPAASKLGESTRPRKDGEAIPIPIGTLPSMVGEQVDSIASSLTYASSVTNQGPPPPDFGLTKYKFNPGKFSYTPRAGTPATSAGSGGIGSPAIPASFEVTGEIVGEITYQVRNFGRTDIASDADSSINQTNYAAVAADLNPPTAPIVHAGRQFMKNQPFRDHFYARDLTVRHELFHCHEDERFGGQGVQAAQTWLNTQTANSEKELFALLPGIFTQIGSAVTAKRAAPTDEQRAYDDGAPLYLARAQAIKKKGDANGYASQAAPSPQQPRPAPSNPAPKGPAVQPAPGSAPAPSK
jgi:hypothetical protein